MSEASRWRSLVEGRYKIVELRSGEGKRVSLQLFNISADPEETRDLAAEQPELAQRLLEQLLTRAEAARGDKKEIESLRDLEAQIEQLRALGYLE